MVVILMQWVYLRCMRTTVTIDDQLLAEAKEVAQRSGTTLSVMLENALRERLARRATATRRAHVELPTSGGGGLLPGVDLDDSAALLEVMDGIA